MKKRLLFFILLVLLLIVYYGYEAQNNIGIGSTQNFIMAYLNNYQKYLFEMTIILSGAIYILHLPILNPIINLRLNEKVFVFSITHYIYDALILAIFFLISYFISGYIFKHNDNLLMIFNSKLFIRLFLFFIGGFTFSNFIYVLTDKINLGILITVFSNYSFLLIIVSFEYFIFRTPISANTKLLILDGYLLLQTFVGIAFFYLISRKKEIL